MSRRLRAGFDVPFEPFALMREGRPTGLLIELVEVLLRGAGVDYELVDLPLAECEPALFSGRIDALAFKAVTPERRLTMDFSDPLIISGAAAFPRQGLPASTDLNAYAGMTAVTTRQGPFWRYLEANFPAMY
jgi:polar amino acid transport system substrate-binding protein